MNLPDYLLILEVKRINSELGIRDWTQLRKTEVLPPCAQRETGDIDTGLEDFQRGLNKKNRFSPFQGIIILLSMPRSSRNWGGCTKSNH